MQLLSTLTLLALPFTSLAAATTPMYRFKADVISGDKSFNGLYLSPAHSGAGFNSALFFKSGTPPKAFINSTDGELIFNIQGIKYPYRMELIYPEDTYSAWGDVQINSVTKGTKAFEINSSGYLVNHARAVEFAGWRVCQWAHGEPELFHNLKEYDVPNPSSCALVNLVAVSA